MRRIRNSVMPVLLLAGLLSTSALAAERTLLRVRLDGPIMEGPSDAAGLLALLEEKQVRTLRDWTGMLEQARKDPKIDGLVMIVESPAMSLAQAEELTRALRAFRAAKPIYCYLDSASNLSYALASVADHITIAEHSHLYIVGLHGEVWFYKGLLDKLGVDFEPMRCGAYKAAVEPYFREQPSDEMRANIDWIFDGLFERWLTLMAESRGKELTEMRMLVDQAPLAAEEARAHGLVDDVSSFGDFKKRIYKEFGKDVNVLKKYDDRPELDIDMDNPFAVFQLFTRLLEPPAPEEGDGIGLIYIEGPIMEGTSDDDPFGGTIAGSTTIRAAFEEARLDDSVRAVVVRVDSPGGSALASDIMWQAATRCAAEKPLIVSMGGVAASGGYYCSIPGDTIFAEKSTITASIGVAGGKMTWRGLMNDKLGITTAEFSRGAHAGIFAMNRAWDDDERAAMRKLIDEIYEQFKGRIMTSRGDRLQGDLEEMAGGRVFTGEQALELGLVDRIGGLNDAIDLAIQEAALSPDCPVYLFPRPSEFASMMSFLQQLTEKQKRDEFEIAIGRSVGASTGGFDLAKLLLPVVKQVAPAAHAQFTNGLRNLLILQRENVSCYLPFSVEVR